jgi:hypothetical protein
MNTERTEKGQFGKGNSGKPKGAKSKYSSQVYQHKQESIYNYFKSFETDNEFYVYAHFNPINNECFYIGKGKGKRAWDKKPNCRNNDWYDYIRLVPNYDVRLIVTGLSEEECLTIEKVLIKSRNPICNISLIL